MRAALVQVGTQKINRDNWDWTQVDQNPFFAPDAAIVPVWEEYLDSIRKAGSSVGAVVEVVAEGVPAGLGAPIYAKLDQDLAANLMSINAVKGDYEGDETTGTEIPTQGATRYAKINDVLEFVIANNTGAGHHPFHAHGFSFQPIAIYRFTPLPAAPAVATTAALIEPPVYEFDYNEMLDVEAVQPLHALKYRVRIADRFKMPDATPFTWLQLLTEFPYDYQENFGGDGDMENLVSTPMGGGLGRWLMHCHILHHAGLGMMTDFCIAEEGAADTSACKIFIDPEIDHPIP